MFILTLFQQGKVLVVNKSHYASDIRNPLFCPVSETACSVKHSVPCKLTACMYANQKIPLYSHIRACIQHFCNWCIE